MTGSNDLDLMSWPRDCIAGLEGRPPFPWRAQRLAQPGPHPHELREVAVAMGLQLGHRREFSPRFDGLEQRTATAVADDIATNVEKLTAAAAGSLPLAATAASAHAAVADAVAKDLAWLSSLKIPV